METIFTKESAISDLKSANTKIIKRHRYFCGLVSDEQKNNIGCEEFFFESPDGQNGELYHTLREMGWKHQKYDSEYYWKVQKMGFTISYTEGDISISLTK